MNTQWRALGVVGLLGIFFTTACDIDDGDPNVDVLNNGVAADDDEFDFTPVADDITFRGAHDNGVELNGAKLNGAKLNGAKLNGAKLNGTALSGADRLGASISGLQFVSGSLLSAFDEGSQSTRIGAQLAETILRFDIDGFSSRKVKIKGVVQSSLQPSVYFYNVQSEAAANVWEAVCLDGAGNPVDAIPLPKAFDPDTASRLAVSDALTWACRGAGLAKPIEWGYIPWESPEMEDAHAAGVRMVRADYCGDGVTHTTNGNAIDVADKWGIQTPDTSWPIEAKWGPDGAVCLNTPRKLQWPRSSIPCAASLPYCTSNGLSTGTPNTNPSQYGGLLITRAVPNDNPSAY